MRKFLLSFLLFLTCCSCLTARPAVENDDSSQVRDEMRQTVIIYQGSHSRGRLLDTEGSVLYRDVDKDGWGIGTGVVIEVRGRRSLVMTNAHVLDERATEKLPNGTLIRSGFMYRVITFWGETCEAHRLTADPAVDLGLLVVDCVAGEPMHLAAVLPPTGAMVQQVGCPQGFHQQMAFMATDGRVLGLDTLDNPMVSGARLSVIGLSTPSTGGSSGSGVYYRGELFGLVSMINTVYEHMTYAVPLSNIRAYLSNAGDRW